MGVMVSKSRLVTVIRVVTFTDIINNCDEKDKGSFWSGCSDLALSVGCNDFALGVVMIILFYKIK